MKKKNIRKEDRIFQYRISGSREIRSHTGVNHTRVKIPLPHSDPYFRFSIFSSRNVRSSVRQFMHARCTQNDGESWMVVLRKQAVTGQCRVNEKTIDNSGLRYYLCLSRQLSFRITRLLLFRPLFAPSSFSFGIYRRQKWTLFLVSPTARPRE